MTTPAPSPAPAQPGVVEMIAAALVEYGLDPGENWYGPERLDEARPAAERVAEAVAPLIQQHALLSLAAEFDAQAEVSSTAPIRRAWEHTAELARQRAGEPANAPHRYLSTSCLHGHHAYCQSPIGSSERTQWVKTPAACKFCGARCVCWCHAGAQVARDAAGSHEEPLEAIAAHQEVPQGGAEPLGAAERRTEWAELQRRSLPGRLRYLAGKLTGGSGPEVVALALNVMADEMDGPPGHSEVTLRAEEIHAEHHPGTFVPSLDSCTEHTRAEYEALAQDLTGGQR